MQYSPVRRVVAQTALSSVKYLSPPRPIPVGHAYKHSTREVKVGDQNFKVTLGYLVSSRPAWATRDPASMGKKKKLITWTF